MRKINKNLFFIVVLFIIVLCQSINLVFFFFFKYDLTNSDNYINLPKSSQNLGLSFKYLRTGMTFIYFKDENGTESYEKAFITETNFSTGDVEWTLIKEGNEYNGPSYYFYFDLFMSIIWSRYEFSPMKYGNVELESNRDCYCVTLPHPDYPRDESYIIVDNNTGVLVEEFIQSDNIKITIYLWSDWPIILNSEIFFILGLITLNFLPIFLCTVKIKKISIKIKFLLNKFELALNISFLIYIIFTIYNATSILPLLIEIPIILIIILLLRKIEKDIGIIIKKDEIFNSYQERLFQIITINIINSSLLFISINFTLKTNGIDSLFFGIKPSGMILVLYSLILIIISIGLPEKRKEKVYYS